MQEEIMDQIGGRAPYAQGKDAVSLISFQAQHSPAPSLFSTRTLLRVAVLSASILSAILISTAYSLTRATAAPSLRSGWLESKHSPLHYVLLRDQTLADTSKINEKATLEVKTLVIAETVVPYERREMLSAYVRHQLEASDVVSSAQKEAVMTMVEMAPVEHSINREEQGEGGSLRNSAVIALIKTYRNNVHFMLIGFALSNSVLLSAKP